LQKTKLSTRWIQWRRSRYNLLSAQDLPAPLPWKLATGEAKARQRVARVLGFDKASEAELLCFHRAGKFRFALTGSVRGLTDEQVDRLRADLAIVVA